MIIPSVRNRHCPMIEVYWLAVDTIRQEFAE